MDFAEPALQEVNQQFQGQLKISLNGELEGYLYKKSPALLRGWQFRRVVLRERKLYWFKCTRKEKKLAKKSKNESDFSEDDVSDNEAGNNQELVISK